jgi:apolipoprotein N-acyltransferase
MHMNTNQKLILIICTLLSAVLLPLALPNELFTDGNPLLGVFALSFFFLALSRAPSFGFAAVLGMIFGAVSTMLANYWLANFGDYSFWTLGGVTLGYVGYNALLAPFIYGCIKMKPRFRVFVIAAVWALYEYLKSSGFLGYPWGLIAYPVHTVLPFVQFTDITGLWGLSFLMAFLNALVAEIILQRFPGFLAAGPEWGLAAGLKPALGAGPDSGPAAGTAVDSGLTAGPDQLLRPFLRSPKKNPLPWQDYGLFALALTALAFGYGVTRMLLPIPVEKTVTMLLIQQNKDPWERGMNVKSIGTARELTRKGINQSIRQYNKPPDLIAWNETALRHVSQADLDFFAGTGTYNLIGAPVPVSRNPFRAYNAAILISPQGRPLEYYAKQHPVPFVESIPFWDIPVVKAFFEKIVGIGSFWVLGDEYRVFHLPLPDGGSLRFSTPICFEDVFPGLCRRFFLKGAEVLINMSNDSWSKTHSALTQHIAAAKFRAIENRRTLVRATNAGVTSVIDPWGRVLAAVPTFRPDYLLARVPVYRQADYTPYTIYGDWFAYVLALAVVYLLVGNAFGFSFSVLVTRLWTRIRHR